MQGNAPRTSFVEPFVLEENMQEQGWHEDGTEDIDDPTTETTVWHRTGHPRMATHQLYTIPPSFPQCRQSGLMMRAKDMNIGAYAMTY